MCICTLNVRRCSRSCSSDLNGRNLSDRLLSIVVIDNDFNRSSEDVVRAFADRATVATTYDCEPVRNIALARNRTLASAEGEFVAFIDDDEVPVADWLASLLQTCMAYDCAGVLGPVRPRFDHLPPAWVTKGRFCERPEHPTGTIMEGAKCRTGNVLLRRTVLPPAEAVFREQFGTGGEDVDFFKRMTARGCVFVWSNEAIAYETVPPLRCRRSYMLRRALLRGGNSLKVSGSRAALILKSVVAAPIYVLLLPVTLPFGHHRFMKCCIRLCDHVGRLSALLGLNPVRERVM